MKLDAEIALAHRLADAAGAAIRPHFRAAGFERKGDQTPVTAADRAAEEAMRALLRAEMPDDMPLIFRFSQHKSSNYAARTTESPQELEAMLAPIIDAGVDMLHTSIRRFWQAAYEGSPLNLAGWAKKVTGLPVMAVGSVGLGTSADDTVMKVGAEATDDYIARLMERFNDGEFDMIAIGRSLISDPDYVNKLRTGEKPVPFAREALATLV